MLNDFLPGERQQDPPVHVDSVGSSSCSYRCKDDANSAALSTAYHLSRTGQKTVVQDF